MHEESENSFTVSELRQMGHREKIVGAIELVDENLEYYVRRELEEAGERRVNRDRVVFCRC